MLDIPQSNQELELDCLNVEITNTKSDRNLNDALNLPSISNGEFNFTLGEWENIAMLQGNRAIFSRDWTNVFNAKIEDKFVCVICFK